jgi:DNA-binding FrmR family transcriptional regulator
MKSPAKKTATAAVAEPRVMQPHRSALLQRLSRISGQVRGVSGMIEQDRYCVDVLTQIAAVDKALDRVALQLLADHTNHCVRDAVARGGEEGDEKVDELLAAVERFARTR